MHRRYPVIQKAFICLLILFPLAGIGQTSFKKKIEAAPVRAYTVGDKLPDLVFKNLINYKSEKASLHSLKGKLILLDFWELSCTNCMAAFPKIHKVKEQFGDRVQVITVTRLASPDQFAKALKTYPALKNFSLPTVLQDDILYQHFPFEFISHVVWIDGNGVVKAITGTEYVTPENVSMALKDEQLPWPVKKDVFGFEYDKPLLSVVNGEAAVPATLYYSALTGYMEGIDGTDREIVDSVRQTVTYNHFNKDLLALADGSLQGQGTGYIIPKYLVLEVKDSSRFIRNTKTQYYDQWAKRNAYCYSVTMPLSMNEMQRKAFVQKDLTRWLDVMGIAVRKEQREVPCYALVKIRDLNKEAFGEGNESQSRYQFPHGASVLKNERLSDFLTYLNLYNNSIPQLVINKTGYPDTLRVNIAFSGDAFTSISNLRKELQHVGFDLVPDKSRFEMHVISDKKGISQP